MVARILVTGGAGFIGSHLVDHLIAAGERVTVLDNFSSGYRANLDEALQSGALRVMEGSVLDHAALDAALTDCDRVFHLAVECVRRSLSQPLQNHETNATGTLICLEAARRAGVQRFVYCSSSEVYGNCGSEQLGEETLCAPVTVYGAAKLAGEHYAKAYHQTYGLPVVVVRPFNSYGPREHEQGDLAEVIPRFVIRVLNGLPPIVFGNGQNGRDFTYVTETARGLALAASCEALLGKVVNIAFGRMVTIRDLALAVARRCGRDDIAPEFVAPRPGDVVALQADTRLAHEILGFRAEIALDEGLERYISWFRAHHSDLAKLLESDLKNWRLPL